MLRPSDLISQVYLELDGAPVPAELMRDLVDVTVETSLHLPDFATVRLHDPRLRWIDDARLAPGTALTISAKPVGRNQQTQPIFDGEIVELEPEFLPGTQELTVRAFNRAHRLTRGQYVRSFINVTDGDLVRKIAQEVGLRAEVGPTAEVHRYVLQNNETNLEFLRSRAAALGYLLFVRGTTLCCLRPESGAAPVELSWGVTLSEFRPRLTTLQQANEVTVRGWDPAQKQEVIGRAGAGRGTPRVGESRSGGEVARRAFNLESPVLVTDRPVSTQGAADRLAQAIADRIAGTFIEAEGACAGDPAIKAGASVRLSAVGERFGGTYFVTAATHAYSAQQGYSTQFSVSGHRPATLVDLLTPARERALIHGLVIGIVTDNQDPEGQGRVKVKYPVLSGEHASDWARLVAPGAGKERGLEFLPEVNDEVLIGFELGDVHHPYVLGGLWNGKDAPPEPTAKVVRGGKVQKRLIRSRTGHVILLDDADGGGGITIMDSKGNVVKLDSQSNALTIEVKGNASIKAGANLTLEATGQVEVKGMGIRLDGGAGVVEVKGSVIKLN